MATKANPVIDPGPADVDFERVTNPATPAPDDAPSAEELEAVATEDEPTPPEDTAAEPREDRRSETQPSRRAGQGTDPTQSPEYRAWQASKDREIAAIRKQAQAEKAALQAQYEAQTRQAVAFQVQQLNAQLDVESDPQRRMALIEQMAEAKATEKAQQIQRWHDYVREQAVEAGLDPNDFPPTTYYGQDGRERLIADISKGRLAKLQKENAELKARVAGVPKTVKTQVAEALLENGLDAGDATPAGRGAGSWDLDLQRVQQGRMSRDAFLKKYRGAT